MRYIKLEDAVQGMSLAYNLYDSRGRMLIKRDETLTSWYIAKLAEYKIDGIYIMDDMFNDINIEFIISPELRAEGLACVREGNIDKCRALAVKMVTEIYPKGSLILDLIDIRTYNDYIYAHCVNVAVISCIIGIELKLTKHELTDLVTAALLHDLGKLSIPDEILNKPERLTQEEYKIIQTHALLSYDIIKSRPDLSTQVKEAVLYHHENVDGSGYPKGIDGTGLNIYAKIIHVADVYDALISQKPYKRPYSSFETSEYIMGGSSIMFDKDVVTALLKCVPLYQKCRQVFLSDGSSGIVKDNTGDHNLRPVIKLFNGKIVDLSQPKNYSITILNEADNEPEIIESENMRQQMINPVKRYKIVVVDDMKTNLEAIRSILRNLYDVILLKSGRQLMNYMEKLAPPDLILMDINMPEMSGVEAAMLVQQKTAKLGVNIPIIFVTAVCNRETVLTCQKLNAAGYILRPYKATYIKEEIQKVLIGWNGVE